MRLVLISAMARNRVIGRRNALPWSIPEEYEKFLAHVRGRLVLLGRSSYEIFGPDLTESRLIVISSSVRTLPDARVASDVDAALRQAAASGDDTVFSAGGASIYRQTLPHADAMYLSLIKGEFEGDTYFPEFDEDEWRVDRVEDHPRYEFRVYERRRPPRGPRTKAGEAQGSSRR